MTEEKTTPVTPVPESKADAPKGKSMPPVLLKGEIKIFPDKRLPQYDRGIIKAYEALGIGNVKSFALVCEKNVISQSEIIHKYAGIATPHLPKLSACGVVDWSLDNKEHFVFVYEDRLGNPVAHGKNPNALGLKPDLVISTIFRNILDVMHAMRDKGIAHGNISVPSIFDGGSPTFENTTLGDMLSAPSGYNQPIIYETITRGLASPLGRGPAELSDDIYALGVTLAALIRTNEPAEGLSDDDILAEKLEIGSFNFIVGKSRFPAAILEFLRGVLNDDIELRWSFDDILTWADGRRVNAKQSSGATTLKASRPLEFARKKILKPQVLSVALPKDAALSMPLVENGELFLWLNRSIQNKVLEARYEEAFAEAKKDAGGSNYADRLACMMAIAMAPVNPIFYRNLKFSPMGFGALLADAAQTKKDLAPFVDIMQSSIVSFWSKCSPLQNQGDGDAVNRIGNCQRFLSQSLIGYGLERCIYYLAPMAPCLSEKLENSFVRSAEDFIRAMEKMSTQKNRPEWFLDRHIVSFLSIRDKSIIEPFLADIAATEKHRHRNGVLKMFSAIQVRDKIGVLPGLSAWISGMLDPLIDRYHDREKRKNVRAQLDKIKDQGNLEKIAALFDNFKDIQQDMRNYSEAMKQFQFLKREYIVLENELQTNKKFGIEAGQQVAALVSGAIAALVVMIYLFVTLMHGGNNIF